MHRPGKIAQVGERKLQPHCDLNQHNEAADHGGVVAR